MSFSEERAGLIAALDDTVAMIEGLLTLLDGPLVSLEAQAPPSSEQDHRDWAARSGGERNWIRDAATTRECHRGTIGEGAVTKREW